MDDELTPAQADALLSKGTGDREVLVALLRERIGMALVGQRLAGHHDLGR